MPSGHRSEIAGRYVRPLTPNPRSGSSFRSGQVHHQASRPDDDDGIGLTKMDWNNDALYDPLPVALAYAKVARC